MRPPRDLFLLGCITFQAIGVRLAYLTQPIRYDEAFTYFHYASQSPWVVVSLYDFPNNHIFHSVCVKVACRLFGNAPWAIRLPALAAGVLLIPAAYFAGRVLANRSVGLLAACLVSSSSLLIEYSTNARGYSIVCLITLLSFSLGEWLLKNPSRAGWAGLAILCAVGFWTIPTMLYPFSTLVAWLALREALNIARGIQRASLATGGFGFLVMTGLVTVLAYAPLLATGQWRSLVGNRFVQPLSFPEFVGELPRSLWATAAQWSRDVPGWLIPLFVAGAVTGMIREARQPGRRAPLLAIAAACSLLLVTCQRVAPFPRVWTWLLPVYLLTVASGWEWLLSRIPAGRTRQAAWSLVFLAVGPGLITSTLRSGSITDSEDGGALRDAEQMVLFLDAQLGPDDRVLAAVPSDVPLEYYQMRYQTRLRFWNPNRPESLGMLQRIAVVVNTSAGPRLGELLGSTGLSATSSEASIGLLKRFPSATIWELRVHPLPPPDAPERDALDLPGARPEPKE
jgi:hypothetical protein